MIREPETMNFEPELSIPVVLDPEVTHVESELSRPESEVPPPVRSAVFPCEFRLYPDLNCSLLPSVSGMYLVSGLSQVGNRLLRKPKRCGRLRAALPAGGGPRTPGGGGTTAASCPHDHAGPVLLV